MVTSYDVVYQCLSFLDPEFVKKKPTLNGEGLFAPNTFKVNIKAGCNMHA